MYIPFLYFVNNILLVQQGDLGTTCTLSLFLPYHCDNGQPLVIWHKTKGAFMSMNNA